jgi:hypothetical protein
MPEGIAGAPGASAMPVYNRGRLLVREAEQVLRSQIAAGQDGGQSISGQIVNPDGCEARSA